MKSPPMPDFFLRWPLPHADPSPDAPCQAAFAWRETNGRFGHQICVRGSDDWIEVISTIEDEGTDDWPSSPPIRQTDVHAAADAPIWFGLGMAGRSHWSASIEPTERGIRIEFACRLSGRPGWIGVTYRIGESARVVAAEGNRVMLDLAGCRLALNPQADTRLDRTTRSDGSTRLVLVPKKITPTTCWSYEWRLAD